MAYDLVVKDALIVDGTGKNAYAGDVAVENGKSPPSARWTEERPAPSRPTARLWRRGSSTPTPTTTRSCCGIHLRIRRPRTA